VNSADEDDRIANEGQRYDFIANDFFCIAPLPFSLIIQPRWIQNTDVEILFVSHQKYFHVVGHHFMSPALVNAFSKIISLLMHHFFMTRSFFVHGAQTELTFLSL